MANAEVFKSKITVYVVACWILFTSSLYLAALVASFGASKACRIFGRKPTILVASLFFIGGAGFSALAEHKWMLILVRILFGIGVGFGNVAVPVLLSGIAPVQHREAVNILFQLFVTIGILIAGIVNYFTSTLHPIEWRASLAIAGVPGLDLFFGSMILTKTPASLIKRGKDTKGKAALKKIRGVDNVALPTICHNWNSHSWHCQLFHFHPPPNWVEGLLSHSRHSRPCPFLRLHDSHDFP
ncbi:hypothetical protein TEA_003978 [Camellia sinensis var. sinensis]|uniref:Major facilitator superfamily (MFS) profile domain-containing protein n=1 Tax=Camellia sinensis var. sinensis TaxID=542762 RepID=A0A4S4DB70_CAMSN|nr:hypothetical protein TEA_003978 [Camellia sinensis var. sinensis]